MFQRKYWFNRLFLPAVLIFSSLFIAACSGSGSTTFSTSGSTGSTSPSPTPSPSPSPTPAPSYTLSVSKSGSGTVTSNVAGINCGSSCSASYTEGTSVTLTASAASGYTFSGWSGACSGTGSCTVSMTQARSVTATFSQTTSSYTLSVSKTGSGTVTSNIAGINCGSTCSATYAEGTSVTLTASPASGYTFSGWSGVCSGTGSCTVTMTQARSVTANFTQSGVVDLNCGGTWTGSEETTTITAWPYRDCFRTNPVAGGRTYMSLNTGAEVVWEQGTGWNGQNSLRVRPPDGSLGNHQGYAGLGGHNFHAVRTKRLNIRYLMRYNSNFARYAQGTKWEIAVKYDYTNPSSPVRLQGCERGITVSDADPQNTSRKRFIMQQGVCTEAWNVPNLNGFNYGAGVRENEWISVENEFDLETGRYRTYITTQDGVFNQSLTSEVYIGAGAYGAPAETVPNPHWWGSIDCSTGCFWDWANLGTVPRPSDTYIWFSHFVMSNSRIGPPAGFVR